MDETLRPAMERAGAADLLGAADELGRPQPDRLTTARRRLRVNRLAGLEHRDELSQPPSPRVGLLGVVEPVDDRVAILLLSSAKNASAFGRASSSALEVVGDGAAPLSLVGCLQQRPSAFARSTSARPAGRILPSAISCSALSRLIRDHRLRCRRGVNRWRK